jgi:uncharacterized protein (DUF58 family)
MSALRRFFSKLHYTPTRRLAIAFAIAAPLWLLPGPAGATVAAVAGSLALVAAFIDALMLPDAKRIRVRRDAPATLGLGESATVTYAVASRWPRPLHVELHDALTPAIERSAALPPAPRDATPWRIDDALLPTNGTVEMRVTITGRERGEHALRPLALRVRGPLGLVRRTIAFDADQTMSVVPSIAGVRRYRLLAVQRRLREAGVRTIRRRGEGTSFANLRDYVVGDDPRHLDWKTSARRGKLITREFSIEQGQTVVIAIDAGRMMTQLSDGISRFEHALASATVLADVATRSGDHVALIVFNDQVRAFVPAAKGALALRRLREAVVPLTPNMAEPDYAGAFRVLAARHRKRSLIVLFTDVVDPRASRSLIAHTVRSAA